MKKKILIFLCLLGCKTEKNISFVQVSDKIYQSQSKVHRFSISAYNGRKLLSAKIKDLSFSKSDTLFLIERIGEPDLEVWGNAWTSKRDVVYEYVKESDSFKDTVFNYKSWNNRYKTNVERFDTTSLDKHKILGGYRTFITQVINGKAVKTFYFHDSYSSMNIQK